MSALANLRREEAASLVLALAAHVALIAWLALHPPRPAPLPLPERMTVTFSDDVAERSTSPDPSARSAPAIAPVISENPEPQPQTRLQPQVRPQPAPNPVARVVPPPTPPRSAPQPASKTRPAAARPAPQPAAVPARPAGGSRIGSDFLKGVPGGQAPGAKSAGQPAQQTGAAVRAALSGAITRQLKPRWVAPQGADADQLVTVLAWDMNPDGTLSGAPRVVSQAGITDANRAQAERHAEQAIRAVRLAAPFDLPDDLYAAWKHVASFRFDRKLSQ